MSASSFLKVRNQQCRCLCCDSVDDDDDDDDDMVLWWRRLGLHPVSKLGRNGVDKCAARGLFHQSEPAVFTHTRTHN